MVLLGHGGQGIAADRLGGRHLQVRPADRLLEAIALEDADFGDRRFDKVSAFDVAPFWQQPKAALGAVREHLAPDGAVYLFWDARHCAPQRARGPPCSIEFLVIGVSRSKNLPSDGSLHR